jgi:hypothetical protein
MQPDVPEPFPFTYGGYTLYQAEAEQGGWRRLWFFAKQQPRSAVPAAKPAGCRVAVDPRGGVPFLRPEPWPGSPLEGILHAGPRPGHKAS